ncbi:hypothetical protein [Allosphingosinicella sp.]|jgi:hypothetical protein|uniref:hypothetical protein n=1 Tax=Allosphingosinicella sp. TaxID=2823234 RepID=UPI002EFB31C2
MDGGGDGAGKAYLRLSREKRERFLEVLSQTGNRKAAADAIGIEPRLMDQRREFDPALDREWTEALDICHRRLSGADGPFDCPAGAKLNVIKRGPTGRLQLVASGQKRWSGTVEDRFIATLAACGCIAASARAVGFSQSSVDQRRRKWPAFAGRIEQALDDAETVIEFRLAAESGGFAGFAEGDAGTVARNRPEGEGAAPEPVTINGSPGFDRDFALKFLKWREEKRRGGAKRGRSNIPPEPPIEEVREEVLRRVAAIRRKRERGGPEGFVARPATEWARGSAEGGGSG